MLNNICLHKASFAQWQVQISINLHQIYLNINIKQKKYIMKKQICLIIFVLLQKIIKKVVKVSINVNDSNK